MKEKIRLTGGIKNTESTSQANRYLGLFSRKMSVLLNGYTGDGGVDITHKAWNISPEAREKEAGAGRHYLERPSEGGGISRVGENAKGE
jgi:hypothetical protein